MTAVTTVLGELAARAGTDAVRSSTEELERWAVAGVRPLAVVQPETPEAIAAVLALCSEAELPVEPAGAGTWLGAGRTPARPPVVVSTARLNNLVEYEPADLVVGVQAGMSHEALTAELARNRQVLTLDPPALPGATIGATAALGAAGPLRARHRTPRDLLLGVQFATGDGRLLNFGGRVVKNVAGYDFVRLLAGSRGTLGIITSMHLLLRSAAQAERTCLLPAATAGEAASLALAIRERIEADAIEVLAGHTAAGCIGEGADLPVGAGWAVVVRLAGSTAAVEEQHARLGALGRATTLAEDAWPALSAAEARAGTYLRLASRPASLGETLQAALELVAELSGGAGSAAAAGAFRAAAPGDAFADWHVAAHGADGIVRLWSAGEAPDLEPEPFADAVEAVRGALGTGSLTCPVLPAALRQAVNEPDVMDPTVAAITAGLRRTFDPAGILSPGRHGF